MNSPDSGATFFPKAAHPPFMLTEIYVEALLVDEGLVDQGWQLWAEGALTDMEAALAWWLIQ